MWGRSADAPWHDDAVAGRSQHQCLPEELKSGAVSQIVADDKASRARRDRVADAPQAAFPGFGSATAGGVMPVGSWADWADQSIMRGSTKRSARLCVVCS